MYEKIILCLLILLVSAHSKKVSTVKNVEIADFANSRLSTILPSIHNDEPLVKDNPKRSLVLLMPLSRTRNEHEKPKEMVQKIKRCGTQRRKNKFLLLKKGDSNRARTDKNFYVGISKQNSDDHIVKNAKHLQESSTTSKRMIDDTYENKVLLRALKDNLNVEDVIINLKSQEKVKKYNTEKYICHCKEDDSSSSSSKKNSSRMLGSSRIDKPEKINNRKLTKSKNVKSDILPQKSPKLLYRENPHELPLPNPINYLLVHPYQGNMNHISPVPILYGIPPNVSPHMVGNKRKDVNVGIPFTSFEGRPNYLVESNQYQPIIHQKHPCSPIPRRHRIENSMAVTSPSTNYVNATTIRETANDLGPNNPIGITEEVQEYISKLTTETPNVDASADSETEANLRSNYPNDITEKSNTINSFNLNKVTYKSKESTEQTERNPDNDLSDYIDVSSTPSVIYDETNGGKFISMKECIRLFGRNVCVLSATSPKKFIKPAQENKSKYIVIRIPEYVTQMSTRKETTLSNNNYGINESNEYLDSTSTESYADADEAFLRKFPDQYPESIEQISKPDVNDKDKSFSTVKNTQITIKKVMDPTIDETAKKKYKLLGKSKLMLNPNDKEIVNTTPGDKSLYSTPLYKPNNDKETNNLKDNQQNRVTTTNSNLNTSPKQETTVINYDSKTDFKEETEKKEIEAVTHLENISQEQSTTMQYIDDKKSSDLNKKENATNNLGVIDSSTSKLPFCDNTLLLNAIRKVINDFTLDARLTKTNDFDENTLQTQGKNLLPEILQVPHLKNILSIPRMENTIVEQVKDVLSHITAIPKRNFTNDWSHGVIKNTLRSILDGGLSGFHHKLPPMTLQEHQFKDGQWKTNLVTLEPLSDQKLSLATPENLRESIKDLLSSFAIASQTDQHIVRNMIVQSVKNSLTNHEDDKLDDKLDDSIIHALNDVLQTLKTSKDIDALKKSNEIISDEDINVAYMKEIPTNNNEIGINVENSTLNGKQNLDVKKDPEVNYKKMETTDYQKAKTLKNNANILTTSELPHLLQLNKEKEEEEPTNKAKIKEDNRDQTLNKLKKTDTQDDAEKKSAESLKPIITIHKAILQSNPSVLTTFESNSTGTEHVKNNIDKESVKDTTTATNHVQETSPNYAYVSDGIILKNTVGAKNNGEEMKHKNEKTLTTSTDEINPLIILERIKFNLPPTKYYSPEILKHATNHNDDKNAEFTTVSTDFIQETSSNYAQVSNDTTLQNIAETKDDGDKMEYPLTTKPDNFISSTNVESTEYKPKISLIDKNILELQQQNFTEDNIIKIHEVTTEVQGTYAKTTYFKAESSSDSPRISSPSYIYSSQLFPSSTTSDDISELQKSQLYYVSDGMKLPLEIKRLEDGSYALSISKNICELLLTRKCPCCVPLQGHIVRSLKNRREDAMTSTIMKKEDQENMYINNIKKDYQSIQPFNTVIARRSALRTQKSKDEKEKDRTNTDNLWKQGNDNLAMISMPVIDFAKKYNLLLNFNEEGILFNEAKLQSKIQNYDKSLMKSVKGLEYDKAEEKNLDNYPDIKKNGLSSENNDAVEKFQDLINVREKKNIPNINFPIFPITQKNEVKTVNDVQNVIQEINPVKQKKINPAVQEINISEESKQDKEEVKWDKLSNIAEGNTTVLHKKETKKTEATESINNEYNVPEIKNFRVNIEKPYRYQRNTNNVVNKRAELVKSMLYWLKGLLVDE